PPVIGAGESASVSVLVTNEGERASETVVFLFLRERVARVARPLMRLVGARRLALSAKESASVRWSLEKGDLSYLDENLEETPASGAIDYMIGFSADPDACIGGSFEARGAA